MPQMAPKARKKPARAALGRNRRRGMAGAPVVGGVYHEHTFSLGEGMGPYAPSPNLTLRGGRRKGRWELPERDKWVLIDGHSLAYRAFYALPADLATSSGQLTNAVYGFTSMLIKVLEDLRPRGVVVAFDKGKPAFRLEKYADYKAHRKPMPEELREQLDIIHAVLDAMGIPYIEKESFEADDVLATIAGVLPEDCEVFIVTSDRDALQLVSDRVKVVSNRRGISDIVIYDAEGVKEKYGVYPGQIVDYLALKGDASDNIPGVPGIGEKTAASLIGEYGSLEGVYEHLEDIRGARARKALEEHRESALLSRELAVMRRDVPLGEGAEEWEMRPWDERELRRVFDSLEFVKLYERLEGLRERLFGAAARGVEGREEPWGHVRVEVEGAAAARRALEHCARAGEVSIYARIEGEGFTRGRMESLSVCSAGRVFRFPLADAGGEERLGSFLRGLADSPGVRVSCFRGKDLRVQCAKLIPSFPACHFDVELAAYLLSPSASGHDLESACRRYLDMPLSATPPGQLDLLQEEAALAESDARAAEAVERLVPPLQGEMDLRELRPLFEEVEMPLQAVLADMELAGVRLDEDILASMREELEGELSALEERAHELAGESFNLNSPQQLSRILFEVLELPVLKKTKTGYATDVEVLTALADMHPIADALLRYRELSKLLNTYVVALPRMIDPATGRLHASYNQAVTSTGRLSSSNPNLQNIPVRTELGRTIRKAFLPTSPHGLILSADYSQIELRVMAHLSGDAGLKRAFAEERDIHAATAAEVFGVPFGEVTAEQRRRAKAINFGIIYGISPFGLAGQLGVSREEAESYIDEYFREYPGVRSYLDRQVEEGTRKGYVATILGRRREIPELAEGNVRLRRLGERLAFNTPIQGSAADIIKLAMLRVHARLRQGGHASRMILQVHDELVVDVADGELQAVSEVVRGEMEGAYELDVPLKVEVRSGPSWYEAK